MYKRLLPTEKWRWYWRDLALPLLATVTVMAIFKHIHPHTLDTIYELFWLIMTAALSLLAALTVVYGRHFFSGWKMRVRFK
jgi:hypothetical protein